MVVSEQMRKILGRRRRKKRQAEENRIMEG
jgi:hypothetical protein